MSSLGLGKLIESEQHRDAIHVAVAPVVAAEKLYPGQDIGFTEDSTVFVERCDKPIGIVDPYLKSPVYPDQSFWMFLYPETITSLRHEWTHPAFEAKSEPLPVKQVDSPSRSDAEQWMRDFAEQASVTFDEAIQAGKNAVVHGDYLIQDGFESARNAILSGDNLTKYWDAFQIITGMTVTAEDREHYVFSCSC